MKNVATRRSIPRTPYLFFAGKGGVGKTTCASATARLLLERAGAADKILLFSTDPAHSLSDSLDISIGNRIRRVDEHHGAVLDAWEMDAGVALDAFKSKHRATLAEIADRGTMLDEADVNELLNLSLPGMDEVMALVELSERDREGGYSRIIVDTAPTGHTSRMLELPDVFERWIAALDRMSEKHRYMVSRIARVHRREDPVEGFLSDLSERLKRVRNILYSADTSSFLLVTIPEAMALEETSRYFEFLRQKGVPVTHIITNRVEQAHNGCTYCAARVRAQRPYLKRIRLEFTSVTRRDAPVLADEVRGFESLGSFARLLWSSETLQQDARRSAPGSASTVKVVSAFRTRSAATGFMPTSTKRLIIVGGKGGVGKTTTAAALAVQRAEERPQDRLLVFSTDPAHSLSDSFDTHVGSFRKGVAGISNLDAIEIDAVAKFEDLKNRYRQWIEEIFTSITGGTNWNVQFDREAMQELISLAPPGIDEIAALSSVSDFLEKRTYTSIILDTAPTGHLLRFLQLPTIALEWVRTFLRLLLKYREMFTSSSVAEELIALSKSIKRVIAILTDPALCDFVAVAIPERMSLAETARLVEGIEALHVNFGVVVINNIIPDDAAGSCAFCSNRRASERRYIDAFRRKFASAAQIVMAPQHVAEIRGVRRLREFTASWTVRAAKKGTA